MYASIKNYFKGIYPSLKILFFCDVMFLRQEIMTSGTRNGCFNHIFSLIGAGKWRAWGPVTKYTKRVQWTSAFARRQFSMTQINIHTVFLRDICILSKYQ